MKRLFIVYISIVMAIVACDFSTSHIGFFGDSDSLAIKRYDRLQYRFFANADYSALQQMNTDYPKETGLLIEDILGLGAVDSPDIYKDLYVYYQDSTLKKIILDVESQYANIDDLNDELRDAFHHLKKELPDIDIPSFYAQIGALDQSVIVGDNTICISLDKYLGKDYPVYKKYYDENTRATMTREYIVPDCIVFYLLSLRSLPNFDNRSQYDRDIHMGILMWIANRMVGKSVLKMECIKTVENYVTLHPDVSIKELLEKTDFSDFAK